MAFVVNGVRLSPVLTVVDDMLKIDGFDSAILGVTDTWLEHPRLVYDGLKILEVLMDSGMSHEDADDYCAFNIEGAYVGESTPLIVWPFEE